ncbi:hypothetical protein AB1Y20_020311 [Prymnesium parvum]|uniref:lipoyl(octanoyl) transferase n=1 Tax=Prymnesium parvum TaxID=97485 RepID=A0AB34JUS1_PRYPA
MRYDVPRLALLLVTLPLAALLCDAPNVWQPLVKREVPRVVHVHNMWDQKVPYATGLAWQRQLHAQRVEVTRGAKDRMPHDSILVLQHHPVLTLGTRSTLTNLKTKNPPFELFRTERGGEVTYHGPGQLVVYPILDLRAYCQDLHWYMSALEESVIRTLGSLGIEGTRIAGRTGVWVDGAKVCAMGVRVTRWITMHGLALNVSIFPLISPKWLDDGE